MMYVFLFLAVLLLSASQILQKSVSVLAKDSDQFFRSIIGQSRFWLALSLLGLGLLVWLFVLTKIEISKAYPMLSLTFVMTTVFANRYMGEKVSFKRWMGILCICVGVSLMGVT